MKYTYLISGIVFAGISITGCGGGGSGGSDSAKFAGRWIVDQTVVANTCPFKAEDPVKGPYDINQVGEEIAVEGQSHFSGFTSSDTTFIATLQTELQCVDSRTGEPVDSTVTVIGTFDFELTSEDMGRVNIIYEYGNCSGNFATNSSCRYETVGVAERESD